jgi:hypothetical protein
LAEPEQTKIAMLERRQTLKHNAAIVGYRRAAFLLSSGLAMLEVLTSLKDRLADAQARIADLRERL